MPVIVSGWCSPVANTMWQPKCFPAAPLFRCFLVRPKSGLWRRSWLLQTAWQPVRLWARCWRIAASRLASPGWCIGWFPGHTAQILWVHGAGTGNKVTVIFLHLGSHLLHVSLSLWLFYFAGSVFQSCNESRRNNSKWTQKEIHWDLTLIHQSNQLFCINLLFIPITPLFC